jgi:stalled ribosome rescue protein Dom34
MTDHNGRQKPVMTILEIFQKHSTTGTHMLRYIEMRGITIVIEKEWQKENPALVNEKHSSCERPSTLMAVLNASIIPLKVKCQIIP